MYRKNAKTSKGAFELIEVDSSLSVVEIGGTFVTIWSGEPTLEAVVQSLVMAQALRDRVGRELTLFGVFTDGTKVPLPGGPVSLKMLENWPKLMDTATNIQYVSLVRPGFTSARLISLVVSAFALTPVGLRRKVGIHKTLVEALDAAALIDPTFRRDEVREAIETVTKREFAPVG